MTRRSHPWSVGRRRTPWGSWPPPCAARAALNHQCAAALNCYLCRAAGDCARPGMLTNFSGDDGGEHVMARIGVDVGGTNTDLVLEADHGVFVHKVASTPLDQSEGVLRGLRGLCEIAKVRPEDVALIVHGTTIATNITIEHNGAEVGMLTTRNFRDILHIGRHKRPHNFSLHFEVPWQNRPLVKRRNRIPVSER